MKKTLLSLLTTAVFISPTFAADTETFFLTGDLVEANRRLADCNNPADDLVGKALQEIEDFRRSSTLKQEEAAYYLDRLDSTLCGALNPHDKMKVFPLSSFEFAQHHNLTEAVEALKALYTPAAEASASK